MSCVAGFGFRSCLSFRFLHLLFFELDPPSIAAGGGEEGASALAANGDRG